jgi:hypothetical protein
MGGQRRSDGVRAPAFPPVQAQTRQGTEVKRLWSSLREVSEPGAERDPGDGLVGVLALGRRHAAVALLDPRSLAAHESEWICSAAARLWCAAAGQPPQVGRRLAAGREQCLTRTQAARTPRCPGSIPVVRHRPARTRTQASSRH